MSDDALLAFVRQHKIAVEASCPAAGAPQSACVGFAVSDAFEIVFDTLESSRKAPWDAGRRVLETRVGEDLRGWQSGLAREAERIERGGSFRLLVDERASAFDPHDALRAVMKERGILCSAYAMVRKDDETMLDDDLRLGAMLRRSFTTRGDAELWLDGALHLGAR